MTTKDFKKKQDKKPGLFIGQGVEVFPLVGACLYMFWNYVMV